jgi:hypothetical protein
MPMYLPRTYHRVLYIPNAASVSVRRAVRLQVWIPASLTICSHTSARSISLVSERIHPQRIKVPHLSPTTYGTTSSNIRSGKLTSHKRNDPTGTKKVRHDPAVIVNKFHSGIQKTSPCSVSQSLSYSRKISFTVQYVRRPVITVNAKMERTRTCAIKLMTRRRRGPGPARLNSFHFRRPNEEIPAGSFGVSFYKK